MDDASRQAYWRSNLRLMAVLLTVSLVSFAAGIAFGEPLNNLTSFMGVPLGFWFAQQGSILTFLALIAVYVWRMDKLDEEFGITEYEEGIHHS